MSDHFAVTSSRKTEPTICLRYDHPEETLFFQIVPDLWWKILIFEDFPIGRERAQCLHLIVDEFLLLCAKLRVGFFPDSVVIGLTGE